MYRYATASQKRSLTLHLLAETYVSCRRAPQSCRRWPGGMSVVC